jgi:tetratricopeptide (TPR) repeat protein
MIAFGLRAWLHAEWRVAASLAAGTGLLYGLTAAPTVYVGDSGELVTAATTLGLAHPTGYPLYLLAGRAWMTLLFFLEPARAMNLLSAACAALALGAGYLLLRSRDLARPAALGAMLLLAGSTTFWSEATVARVYTPTLLLMALASFHLSEFYRGGPAFQLRLAFLWLGLGLAVHTFALALAPGFLPALWTSRVRLRERLLAGLWLLPGAACYLYVPIASAFDPAQDWGDPESLSRLLRYLRREDYWQRRWVRDGADVARTLGHWAGVAQDELTWVGLAAAAAGLLAGLWRRRWLLGALLAVATLNLGLVLSHGALNDLFQWHRYILPALAALALLAGLGLDVAARAWPASARRWSWALVVLALVPALLHLPAQDRHRHGLARDYNARILERLPADAVLIADGDNQLFPLSYLHHALDQRPDVELVLQGINVLGSMALDLDRRPVFFTHYFDLKSPDVRLLPWGLVYRLVRADQPPPAAPSWGEWAVPSLEDPSPHGPLDFLSRSLAGDYFLMKAVNLEGRDLVGAVQAARDSRRFAFDNPNNQVNAGLLLERVGLLSEALEAFGMTLQLDPRDAVADRHVGQLLPRMALKENQQQVEVALQASVAAYNTGDREGAVRALEQALAASPRSARLHYNLAALYLSLGLHLDAERELLRTLDAAPDDATALRDLNELQKRVTRDPAAAPCPAATVLSGGE